MIGRKTKWKVTIVDGGNGCTYTKEVTVSGSEFSLLKNIDDHIGNMYPNSIQKLTIEYIGEVDEDQSLAEVDELA